MEEVLGSLTQNYSVTVGASSSAPRQKVVLPNSLVNQPNFRFRFRYKAGWSYYVGIDSIQVFAKSKYAYNWTSSIGGYSSSRKDSIQVRPSADAYYYLQLTDSSSGCFGSDTAIVRTGLIDPTKIFSGGTSGSRFLLKRDVMTQALDGRVKWNWILANKQFLFCHPLGYKCHSKEPR